MLTRAQFRKQLQEGLNAVFGMRYSDWKEEWTELFITENSGKAYEEDVLQAGLGAAPVKPEGSGVSYDEGAESYTSRYVHETIALAFAITEEAVEDGLYGNLGAKYAKALAKSMRHTKEVKGAGVFNNGFSASYAGGDGVALFSTAHPLWGGGDLSNRLSTNADLSESALEQLSIQISEWTDERGIPLAAMIKKLAIATDNQYIAARILKSQFRTGTGDNDINALYHLGTIAEGFCVNHRFTDPDSWFLITDVDDGMKHMRRKALSRGMEGDFESGNMRYKARERYSFGWSDWRGAAGSQGGG